MRAPSIYTSAQHPEVLLSLNRWVFIPLTHHHSPQELQNTYFIVIAGVTNFTPEDRILHKFCFPLFICMHIFK